MKKKNIKERKWETTAMKKKNEEMKDDVEEYYGILRICEEERSKNMMERKMKEKMAERKIIKRKKKKKSMTKQKMIERKKT